MSSGFDAAANTATVEQRMRELDTVLAQLALRSLRAIFGSDPANLVGTIVFNGIVEAIEPSTGQAIVPCLITLRATRDQFTPLVLERVDPVACIRKYFAADVSAHPEELQAVQPVMDFDLADPRIVDPVDILSELDQRPNLLEYSPTEFESFVQNLFTKGILITTSGFGPSSYEFANGKPLQLIDGSGLLALCKQYEIPARIVPTQRRPSR